MTSKPSAVLRAPALDLVSAAMSTRQRPLDFALILHMNDAPPLDALRSGATSARRSFPASGCFLRGGVWTFVTVPRDGGIATVGLTEVPDAVERFVDAPFDPRHELSIRQLAIYPVSGTKLILVSRFHHALCDGVGAAMWLAHQLDVAWGSPKPAKNSRAVLAPLLRGHRSPVRRSRYAYKRPSDALYTARSQASPRRRWHSFELDATRLRGVTRSRREFSYSDLLATCFLEAIIAWNRARHPDGGRQIGLWYPVNIREDPFAGFGNGTSRIRIYPRYDDGSSLADKCRAVREQVAWCKRHGEWAVPETHPLIILLRLSRWTSALAASVIRAFVNRPGVDMGTAVFTHAEGFALSGAWVGSIERIENVGMLHERYPIGLTAVTIREKSWFTLTFDPARFERRDVSVFLDRFHERLRMARELR